LAKYAGAPQLIELSNIAHVYDKDPNIYKDAKPYDHMTWDEMLQICKGPWKPGLNIPLDPMAAKEGAKNSQKVVFLAGIENLKNYLDKKRFTGTVIK
jgi:uridylate kinase